MKKILVYLFLFLLVGTISLSPRIPLGNLTLGRSIDLRLEDIVLAVGLILWTSYLLFKDIKTFKEPPLFWPIILWLLFGFASIILNLLIGNDTILVSFFYFLKEIEFFLLYFFVCFCVFHLDSVKPIIYAWMFFVLINIVWIIFIAIIPLSWSLYYGPTSFIEPQGPFPSGGFFLILFIFLFNFFVFYYQKLDTSYIKKIIVGGICCLPAIGVIASGSRTAVFGLIMSVIVFLFVFARDKFTINRLLKIFLFIIVVGGLYIGTTYLFGLSDRLLLNTRFSFEYMSDNPVSRIGIFKQNVDHILHGSLLSILVGRGVVGEAHSQYMRVLIERGVVGFGLFVWWVFMLVRLSYYNQKNTNDNLVKALSVGLFVATIVMLIMAIPNDVFMVVKPDEVYWFFTALALALYAKNNRSNVIHAI